MSTYFEKLKDPRWQKRRLQLLEAAGWACEECGVKEKELHVHHGCYGRGVEPWEYANVTMHVLCVECHPVVQGRLEAAHSWVAGLSFGELGQLIRILENLAITRGSTGLAVSECGKENPTWLKRRDWSGVGESIILEVCAVVAGFPLTTFRESKDPQDLWLRLAAASLERSKSKSRDSNREN